MKPFLKFIALASIVPLLIALYFFENIKGYYRFKQYCEKEGGLKVYEPIKKGVGLLAKDKDEAHSAALLENIGFVRYKDADGNFYDIRYIGGHPQKDSSYERKPSDLSMTLNYEWRVINMKFIHESRLGKSGYEIFNITKRVVSVNYSIFHYSKFDRKKTIFDAPSSVGCFDAFSDDYRKLSPLYGEIDSAFKDEIKN